MSLRWMDGFDLYTTSSQLLEVVDQGNSKQAVTYELSNPANVTVSSSGGRFGGGRLVLSQSVAGTGYLDVLLGDNTTAIQEAIFVQFAVKFHTFSGGVVDFVRMRDDVGGFPMRLEVGSGNLRLKDASNSTVETVENVFVTGSWHYLQIKMKAGDGGDGQVRVLVDNVEVINDTSSDFLANLPEMDRFRILTANNRHASFDDLVIMDDEGTENNDFLGDVIIQTIVPDGTGNSDDWVPRAEANPYQQVDDPIPGGHDSQTTRAHSPDQGDKSLFNIGDMTPPASVSGSTPFINKIHAVQANSVVTNKMTSWEDPLPTYQNSTTFSRYLWPSASQVLRGPFSTNTQAVAFFDDKFWYQSEGSRANIISDIDLWTIRGSCTRSLGESDPTGGTTAYKFENVGAGANDAFFYTTAGGAADSTYSPSVFIKRIDTSGELLILNPFNTVLGNYRIDLADLSNKWEHITRFHPAVTITAPFANNGDGSGGMHFRRASPGNLDFYAWFPQTEENTFPSSPISQSGTRSTDRFVWESEDIPTTFYTGSWTVSTYSEHESQDLTGSATPHYLFWLNSTNNLCLSGSGSTLWAKLATTSGSLSRSITYGPSNKVDYTIDFEAGSITVSGAISGDGTTAGIISDWPSSVGPYIGSDDTPANHFFGLISEPVDNNTGTSFRQRIYLNGVENSGSAAVPVINAPTGFGTFSDVFETRPDTSSSWSEKAVNDLQGGFEHV